MDAIQENVKLYQEHRHRLPFDPLNPTPNGCMEHHDSIGGVGFRFFSIASANSFIQTHTKEINMRKIFFYETKIGWCEMDKKG